MSDAPRISMSEWKPENLYDKLSRLDQQRSDVELEKLPITSRKKEIEGELSEYNVQLKKIPFHEPQYNQLNSMRGRLVKEKTDLEVKLMEINQRLLKLNKDIDLTRLELRKKPTEAIKEQLLELRDKYLAFSADTTRVSSMRSMSAKFTEEIQSLLKYFL